MGVEAAGAPDVLAADVDETGPERVSAALPAGRPASKATSTASKATSAVAVGAATAWRRAGWRMVVLMTARKAAPEAVRKFLLRGVLTGHPKQRARDVR